MIASPVTPEPLSVVKVVVKNWSAFRKLFSPVPRGNVRFKLGGPWLACRIGARFPAITLTADNSSYRLEEAVTTGCAPDSASFDYAKVVVRGWDPATKQN